MKNKILIYILSLFVLSGCNGFLDEVDQDKLIPETTDHYASLLLEEFANIYASFMTAEIMTDNVSEDPAALTSQKDDFKTVYTWQREIEIDENGSRVRINDAWKNIYKDVAVINYVLDLIDEASGTREEKDFIKGEAYFCRSLSYFNLVNLYAKPYDILTANNELGVPIRTGIGMESVYYRNTVEETYIQIEADLIKARDLINNSGIIKSKWHPSVETCDLLMSRVKLYKNDWKDAIEYATAVIANKNLSSMIIGSAFVDANNEEILYSFHNQNIVLDIENMKDKKGYTANSELISLYHKNDNRLKVFFDVIELPSGKYYYSKKHERSIYTNMGFVNFRVAEAYLNRAEAYVMDNKLELAISDIKELILSRYNKSEDVIIPATKEELLVFILNERRKELCFEDHHRWFDLKRMKNRPEIKHSFSLIDHTGVKTGTETYILYRDDFNYVLPIPMEERENNPLIRNNVRYEKLPVTDDEIILP